MSTNLDLVVQTFIDYGSGGGSFRDVATDNSRVSRVRTEQQRKSAFEWVKRMKKDRLDRQVEFKIRASATTSDGAPAADLTSKYKAGVKEANRLYFSDDAQSFRLTRILEETLRISNMSEDVSNISEVSMTIGGRNMIPQQLKKTVGGGMGISKAVTVLIQNSLEKYAGIFKEEDKIEELTNDLSSVSQIYTMSPRFLSAVVAWAYSVSPPSYIEKSVFELFKTLKEDDDDGTPKYVSLFKEETIRKFIEVAISESAETSERPIGTNDYLTALSYLVWLVEYSSTSGFSTIEDVYEEE